MRRLRAKAMSAAVFGVVASGKVAGMGCLAAGRAAVRVLRGAQEVAHFAMRAALAAADAENKVFSTTAHMANTILQAAITPREVLLGLVRETAAFTTTVDVAEKLRSAPLQEVAVRLGELLQAERAQAAANIAGYERDLQRLHVAPTVGANATAGKPAGGR